MQLILRGTLLKKYKQVLVKCKELAKGLSGDQWNLVAKEDLKM